MKTTLFLRIASILTLIHAALHTIGGLSGKPAPGLGAVAFAAMHTNPFHVLGVTRTYWDFYMGLSFAVAVFLAAEGLLFWFLGSLAKNPRRRSPPHPLALRPGLPRPRRQLLHLSLRRPRHRGNPHRRQPLRCPHHHPPRNPAIGQVARSEYRGNLPQSSDGQCPVHRGSIAMSGRRILSHVKSKLKRNLALPHRKFATRRLPPLSRFPCPCLFRQPSPPKLSSNPLIPLTQKSPRICRSFPRSIA